MEIIIGSVAVRRGRDLHIYSVHARTMALVFCFVFSCFYSDLTNTSGAGVLSASLLPPTEHLIYC